MHDFCNDALSVSDCTASKGSFRSEWWIGKDANQAVVKYVRTFPARASNIREKSQNFQPEEPVSRPHAQQDCYPPNRT
jgi:hypothetical protein